MRTFPVAPGNEKPPRLTLSSQSYETSAPAEETFAWVKDQLTKAGWAEQPGGYVTEHGGSGTFRQGGFTLSLAVHPVGGESMVSIFNHGNVDLAQIPIPAGAEPLYAGPVSASYVTPQAKEEAAAEIRQALTAAGWEPYGMAGDAQEFLYHGVKLTAQTSVAPAQGGKTVIQYSARLIPIEIPIPQGADKVQYSDLPAQVAFDADGSVEEVAATYGDRLTPAGWKPTTEKPIKDGFRYFMIFRDEAGDLLDVQYTAIDDRTRVLAKYQTAAEVAAETERAQAMIAAKQEAANRPKPEVTLKLPEGAKAPKWTATRVEFTVAVGQGRQTVQAIRDQLLADGWKEESSMLEEVFGTISLSQGDQSLSLGYIESGILPADITINGTNLELKKAE